MSPAYARARPRTSIQLVGAAWRLARFAISIKLHVP